MFGIFFHPWLLTGSLVLLGFSWSRGQPKAIH